MSTAISVQSVEKTYPAHTGGGITTALDKVSVEVAPGELFFLLGPSGCGKTTLLRVIAGFIEPTGGRVLFNGEDVTHAAPSSRNTGMVFQSYALWPHMTVAQNVAFGLDVRRVGRDERDARVREALTQVRMESYADRKPNQLSGGQQQRVALARALVIRPRVLLLDEPLSNLDAKLRIELRSEIRRICKGSGITTVYVTHDQKEALSMADRVAIMTMGRISQIGTPAHIYRKPASRFVAEFLGETNFLPGVVADRRGAGVAVSTPAGVLESADAGEAGKKVTISLRPEARAWAGGANTLSGRMVSTTYLGELAQHHVRLADGTELKVGEINPGEPPAAGAEVSVAVDLKDVVLIPE